MVAEHSTKGYWLLKRGSLRRNFVSAEVAQARLRRSVAPSAEGGCAFPMRQIDAGGEQECLLRTAA